MNNMKKQSTHYPLSIIHKFGFTFIEILVVATIIGVLATIGAVSYQSANIKSRDGKRQADLEQIRAALEMYRADNSTYPATGSLSSGLTPTYIQSIPTLPANTKRCSDGLPAIVYGGGYISSSPWKTYSLCIKLEVGIGSSGANYTVYNP